MLHLVLGLAILGLPFADGEAGLDCLDGLGPLDWTNSTLFNVTYACVPPGWEAFFGRQDVAETVLNISNGLVAQTAGGYATTPDLKLVFAALYATPLSQLKAVILGQDPAPEPGAATGLAFSVEGPAASVPTIGRIIFEVFNDEYCGEVTSETSGDLSVWSERGVLLLNSALTLRCEYAGGAGNNNDCSFFKPGSNVDLWAPFTDALIAYISAEALPSSFILWGFDAQQFRPLVDESRHKVLAGGHPSPLADWQRFMCGSYFLNSNAFLVQNGRKPVDWNLCECQCLCRTRGGAVKPVWTRQDTFKRCTLPCSSDCQVEHGDVISNLSYWEVERFCIGWARLKY